MGSVRLNLMSNINYNSDCNSHSYTGAAAALGILLADHHVSSLLDVGCGPGTWITAAVEAGVPEVCGLDGIAPVHGLPEPARFIQQDLSEEWSLGRRFDMVLCLEVAEHLDAPAAPNLVRSLCAHTDLIMFSAAIPGQSGQHHVNCQWPEYWQALFNIQGFCCSDDVRWKLWDRKEIEVWYRQNIFIAFRSEKAGTEPRIRSVLHPELFKQMVNNVADEAYPEHLEQIRDGRLTPWQMLLLFSEALIRKTKRRLTQK